MHEDLKIRMKEKVPRVRLSGGGGGEKQGKPGLIYCARLGLHKTRRTTSINVILQ